MGTFIGTATFQLEASYAKASDLSALEEKVSYSNSPITYSNGTGANQANTYFSDTRTLAATNESFDMNALVDKYGDTLVNTKIRLLFIRHKGTVAGQSLSLSGNFMSSIISGASPTLVIRAGGYFLAESPIDGYPVTQTSVDVLTVTNTATFDYDIIIIGSTA